jgi:hypothetical protein
MRLPRMLGAPLPEAPGSEGAPVGDAEGVLMPHPISEELLRGAVRADMMHQACIGAIAAGLPRLRQASYLLGLYKPRPSDLERAGVEVNPFTGRYRFKVEAAS